MSKLELHRKQQELIADLETVAGSLAIWAKDKFDHDDWSIADVKYALKNAAKICDGVLTKFIVALMLIPQFLNDMLNSMLTKL